MQIIDRSVYNFSKDNPPFARVSPGELLCFHTLDCFSGQLHGEEQAEELDMSKINPAAGPVYIEGAEPGDVLVVDILAIEVADKGFACSIAGTGPLCHLAEVRTRVVPIQNGVATFNDVQWLASPMIGVIGTAPAEGAIPCGFAGSHGGNIDSKYIKKGARVYFPVRVPGALLQMGDLHASMGDGEVSGTGVEIPGRVLVNTKLLKHTELHWPVTETPDAWIVNTVAPDYDTALRLAAEELCRLMQPAYGWDATDIFIYLSIHGDAGINQGFRPAGDDMLCLRFLLPKAANKQPLL